jgi:hypothetical protein
LSFATSGATPFTRIGDIDTFSTTEVLKYEADPAAQCIEFLRPHGGVNVLPVERNRSAVDLLESIDRADQRRFSRTGRPADDHDFAACHLRIDVLQDRVVAVALADLRKPDRLQFLC